MKLLYKILIVNIFIFSLLIFGGLYNIIQPFFERDITHISYFVAVLMFFNVLVSIYVAFWKDNLRHWIDTDEDWSSVRYLHYIVGKFFYIGIAGTFLAMIYLFSHIDLGKITDVESIRILLGNVLAGLIGIGTTSLVGILGYLWSSINNFILFKE